MFCVSTPPPYFPPPPILIPTCPCVCVHTAASVKKKAPPPPMDMGHKRTSSDPHAFNSTPPKPPERITSIRDTGAPGRFVFAWVLSFLFVGHLSNSFPLQLKYTLLRDPSQVDSRMRSILPL